MMRRSLPNHHQHNLPAPSPPGLSESKAKQPRDDDKHITNSFRCQGWLSEKQVKSVQDKADLEIKETRKLYTEVLDRESMLDKELGALIEQKEQLRLRKKELLHRNWSEHVFEPIRKQIDMQMNSQAYTDHVKRKHQQYKEYIEHLNKKGHVFLHTVAPEEYYAMSIHPSSSSNVCAQTKVLRDPLLYQERQQLMEESVIHQCTTGSMLTPRELNNLRLPPMPLVPLGRHGTDSGTWLEMPLADIESPVRIASSNHKRKPLSCLHRRITYQPQLKCRSAVR